MHVRIQIGKTAGGEDHHFGSVELVSHTQLEIPRKDGDVLPLGVPVRGDLVAVGDLSERR
jgi:hypothetical protein